ncbi:MAG: flagellar biosynthesis protein FlhF [Pseudobdellovibrionaceae bacterium]
MQVKKFEARTMKEALEMVKAELGPEAIILSARDNNKTYGLVGDGSVEITAAVSDETLQRKRFTEARMRDQEKIKFNQSSARSQKDLIEKMVNQHLEKNKAPRAITSQRYADIDEESLNTGVHAVAKQALAALRTQQAAKAAAPPVPAALPPAKAVDSSEMQSLKSEIANLKQVLAQFQNMPQKFIQGHPGAEFGLPYDLSFVFEKLSLAGMAPEIAADICGRAQKDLPSLRLKNHSLVEGWVARQILETTKTVDLSETMKAKVHIFIGAAGSGKTTTLVKMASHLVVRQNKKVAILSADTFKVGASDQMRIYAQILNVPFSVIRHASDWYQIMNYVNSVDYILVDYPGLSLRNSEEGMNLKNLMPPATLYPRTHLVLSTLAKDQDVTELGRRYSIMDYQDVIFTGLDESVQHGTIYNFMRRFDVPLHSFGIGSRVPEDFEFATKERVLDLLLKITQANKQEQQIL